MPSPEDIAPSANTPMIPAQRREQILRQLRKHQVLSVHQIMEMFDCSHMTVRRDIALLEQEGRAYSVTGGVRIASQVHSEPSHQSKAVVEHVQKEAMARLAAQLLRDDMTVYLDAGTTTLEIVPFITALSGMTVLRPISTRSAGSSVGRTGGFSRFDSGRKLTNRRTCSSASMSLS